VGTGAADFAKFIVDFIEKWRRKVIRAANIKPE
jgi:hypothetical protein